MSGAMTPIQTFSQMQTYPFWAKIGPRTKSTLKEFEKNIGFTRISSTNLDGEKWSNTF